MTEEIPQIWEEYQASSVAMSSESLQQMIRNHWQLFKTRSDQVLKLKDQPKKVQYMYEEWINAATEYCSILFNNDLSFCDDLAIWLFTQLYLIMYTLRDRIQEHQFSNQVKTLDFYYNLCITKSPIKKELNIVVFELNELINSEKKQITNGQDSTKERAVNSRNNEHVKSTFYPSEDDTDDDDDEADGDFAIDMYNVRITEPELEVLSISYNNLLHYNLDKIQFINMQHRQLNLIGYKIINLEYPDQLSKVAIDTNCNMVVFFTRSDEITYLEKEVYKILLSKANMPPCYWLEGGYVSFKTLVNTLTEDSQSKSENTQPPAYIRPPMPLQSGIQGSNFLGIPSLPHTIANGNYNSPFSVVPTKSVSPTHGGEVHLEKSLTMPTSFDHLLDYKQIPPPLVKLQNAGSTCYINSMIQCLFRLSKFRLLFVDDDEFQKCIKSSRSHNHKLSEMFKVLFEGFYKSSAQSPSPPLINVNPLLKIINTISPELNIPNEQQDTSQFLYILLDDLHKELRMTDFNLQSRLQLLIPKGLDYNSKFYRWYLKSFQDDGFSVVQNLFSIVNQIEMKCERCGYSSVRYETSNMLHLNLQTKQSCSLNDVILQNMKSEEMSERLGNAWDCDGCKKMESELKRLTELVEQDSYESSENGKTSNNNSSSDTKKRKLIFFKSSSSKESKNKSNNSKQFTFDTRYLTNNEIDEYEKLSEILLVPKVAHRTVKFAKLPDILVVCFTIFDPYRSEAKIGAENLTFPLELVLNNGANTEFKKYVLKSRIDHLGTSIASGHYTAIVYSDQMNTWVECDDDRLATLEPANKSTLRDESVYLLFYEIIN